MQANYTLKKAVKTAIAIAAISAQANVYALGLGNIQVSSHLGQPLRANIKIQGASLLKNVNNLRVISDSSVENQLSHANFKLSKVVDDVAILTVTTDQILSEPIVNLSIVAENDSNTRRDYVLLLDPPINTNHENKVETPTISEAVDSNEVMLNTASTTNKPAQSSNKPEKITKKQMVATQESNSRLSISAGEASYIPIQYPPLRMDMQLQFKPENAPVSLQNTVADNNQDALLAADKRITPVTSQIDQPPQKNHPLKTANEVTNTAKVQQPMPANASSDSFFAANFMNNKLDWLGFVIGAALLFSSASIINKWRLRRKQKLFEQTQFAPTVQGLNILKATNEHDSFFDFDKDLAFNKAIEDTTQHIDFNDDIEEIEAEIKPLFFASTAEKSPAFLVEQFEENHNVIDHADVFLSHGRTSLAIQLLHNHLIEHPKKSVTEWLFLLDLLAKENMQAMYEQTALECKEHFNMRISDFSNDEGTAKNSLEDFPRLVAGLEQVWGTPAAQIFLDDLIYNSRLEARVGFEKPVIEELLLLKNIAHEAISTAEVIQLDDKKLALKAQKEAKLAAIKEDRIKKVNELIEQKIAETRAQELKENSEDMFEFSLAEYN